MKVEIIDYQDNWQAVKNAAMNTIGKENGGYPPSGWKRKILLAEHSPIRLIELTIRMKDIPYWVSVHLVRHKIGIEHWVATQRTDRTGVKRDELPQGALVDHTIRVNAQALIFISRRRLCNQASPETRALWDAVRDAVKTVEPELASLMCRECIYRGFCPEMMCCGYVDSAQFEITRMAYLTGVAIKA